MKRASIMVATAATLFTAELQARVQAAPLQDQIAAIAAGSRCASANWNNRGRAPKAYIRGMALVFAKAICQPDRQDVKVVSAASGALGADPERTDALKWHDAKFRELGMLNATAGVDTLRHAYTLLISLGMQESSGRLCVGRDRNANFSSADTAEAGLFQTSWGARHAHPALTDLFDRYSANQTGCLPEVFSQNVTCGAWDARTWGEGKGADWQKLSKACPVFAAEYGAVLIRTSGGRRGEFGPMRRRQAEIRPACDSMLSEVQALVQANPQMCQSLQQ